MKTLEELIALVKKANRNQIDSMLSDFDGYIGFYREDRRIRKNHIIACLENCYESETLTISEKMEMEEAVLNAMSH